MMEEKDNAGHKERKFTEETPDYNDGSGNLMDYYYQTIEVQARQYAELAVADYYGRIRECLTTED